MNEALKKLYNVEAWLCDEYERAEIGSEDFYWYYDAFVLVNKFLDRVPMVWIGK